MKHAESRSEDGSAAVEFALILPVVLTLLLGAADLIRYMNTDRHVQNAARAAAQIVAGGVNSQGNIGQWLLVHGAANSARLMIPEIVSDAPGPWWTRLAWDGALVRFTPTVANCTQNCAYTARTRFAWGRYGCGDPIISPTQGAGATVSIPPGLVGPADLVVIRYAYAYKPRFAAALLPAINISHQATMSAEASALINPVNVVASDITICS
ncbi:hypothetical protein GCM10007036_34080 [Alsobacter metallidurans]|uniref:TadE-like domain-containing protein n=2 Tax=Alsobacter metallidurans TaxID=340221 RepID=A0A917MIJ5_9HYPH|nr:hypothetical protein GCM10007036_34080 [Alsobacter metallidurans]